MNFPATAGAAVARQEKKANASTKKEATHWNTHMMTIDYG